jgi:hypothetical protein
MATLIGAVLLAAGCASGGGRLPEISDPNAAMANADRAIADALRSNAESLAPGPLGSARQNLADARAQFQIGNRERAALLARIAVADAILAKEQARRAAAEQARDEVRAELERMPPRGGAR